MCRLEDSFFGLLTLRQGSLLIGWSMLPLSVVMLIMEFLDPSLRSTLSRAQGEPINIIPWMFVMWTLADIAAYLCLLIGVYKERPPLLVACICIISLGILGTVLETLRTVRNSNTAEAVYVRIANTCVVIEAWLYMIIVIYNCYMDILGIDRGASLINFASLRG